MWVRLTLMLSPDCHKSQGDTLQCLPQQLPTVGEGGLVTGVAGDSSLPVRVFLLKYYESTPAAACRPSNRSVAQSFLGPLRGLRSRSENPSWTSPIGPEALTSCAGSR
jgi:hypothetical protein